MKLIKILLEAGSGNGSIWYHGSSKPVQRFLYSLVGTNSERITNYHGYGIYFISDINRAKSYGDIITKVSIDDNADIMKGRVEPSQLKKIYNQLVTDNVQLRDGDTEWYNNPKYEKNSVNTDIEEFNEYLMRAHKEFKSSKDVSDFYLRAGIDGMQVTNDVGDNILVVFNEEIITIIN
jgi:hypothetical protein